MGRMFFVGIDFVALLALIHIFRRLLYYQVGCIGCYTSFDIVLNSVGWKDESLSVDVHHSSAVWMGSLSEGD